MCIFTQTLNRANDPAPENSSKFAFGDKNAKIPEVRLHLRYSAIAPVLNAKGLMIESPTPESFCSLKKHHLRNSIIDFAASFSIAPAPTSLP